MDPLELLWDQLLSRQPEQIRMAYNHLTPDEQVDVLRHLGRMASEPGWHTEQVLSARAALNALGERA